MFRLLSLILVVLFLPDPGTATACTCIKPRLATAQESSADAIFTGTVTEVERVPAWPNLKNVTFAVDTTWKGTDSYSVTLITAWADDSCGIPFRVGESWLVYAVVNGDSNLSTGTCTRTMRGEVAHEDLKVLGVGRRVVPAGTIQPGTDSSDSEAS